MRDPLTAVSTRTTPQDRPADPRQAPNNAGGYTFTVSDDVAVHRFLTIGTTGGTYYVAERDHTLNAAEPVLRAARERPQWLVDRVVDVSTAGRAPRQQPAILALAAAAGLGDDDGRRAALDALPRVARTGATLITFCRYVRQFRGWGRGLRRAVSGWYTGRDPHALAHQLVKYRQRDGFTQRDLMRLAHPRTTNPEINALLAWATHGNVSDATPRLVHGYLAAQTATSPAAWARIIAEHRLPWEALPDAALTEPDVWHALLRHGLPQTALMRQLPRLTRLGVFDDRDTRTTVCRQLTDPNRLRDARVHPMAVLLAARTYAGGRSLRGRSTWTPHADVIDALDRAFYESFGAVQRAGGRHLLALDVSGSMGMAAGGLPLSCREASAALALVTMATEPHTDVVGFTSGRPIGRRYGGWRNLDTGGALSRLSISPRQRLDDAVRAISDLTFGGTDCSLPARWALEHGHDYDTIAIYTDSETWAGAEHPHQALTRYRQHVGHPVRQAVLGMTATRFSIADPTDPHSLDIAGLDAAVPNLLADFARGDV